MYFRRKTSGGRAYLQIVESRREGDQVRARSVVADLGGGDTFLAELRIELTGLSDGEQRKDDEGRSDGHQRDESVAPLEGHEAAIIYGDRV